MNTTKSQTVCLTWHASKYKVYKRHQKYILQRYTRPLWFWFLFFIWSVWWFSVPYLGTPLIVLENPCVTLVCILEYRTMRINNIYFKSLQNQDVEFSCQWHNSYCQKRKGITSKLSSEPLCRKVVLLRFKKKKKKKKKKEEEERNKRTG